MDPQLLENLVGNLTKVVTLEMMKLRVPMDVKPDKEAVKGERLHELYVGNL
ncbi:hypothetical protein HPP92_008394 [Vanilla planifolia]|uniref:Uncharacterized protein n=1 Tax=Vanilla planifolia TaxID=51239 RepID=A0A835V5C6_VANPL|nr:hypothetical protein HPP92_008394 [Vanilla planifolia]